MTNYDARVARLEQQVDPVFVVIVRQNGETDEDAWAGYLERRGLPSGAMAPIGRVVFISEADVAA